MKDYFSFSGLKSLAHFIINFFNFSDLNLIVKKIIIIGIAFIAPVAPAILAVYFLILVDLITGLLASKKEKQHITSSGLSRTIGKVLIYSTTIIVSFVVHKYLLAGFEFPIESLVSGFIALTETKSIFENLDRLSNNQFLKDLIVLLSNERIKILPPKKTKKSED